MQAVSFPTTIRAIIGLGNPGSRFSGHRHNVGYMLVNALAAGWQLSWQEHARLWYATVLAEDCASCTMLCESKSVYLIKAKDFMNDSGKIVSFLREKYIGPDECLVLHDELEKKFGTLSLRQGGSARGHNGLRSLISAMGADFWRIRIGIGRPECKEDVPHYVLSNFSAHEAAQLDTIMQQAQQLICG